MAKKTITIKIDKDAFNGLNNAVAAYLDILFTSFAVTFPINFNL